MFPKVSIIILNWNGWKDTIECLESLYQIDYPNYDVIVVDNASKNESIEKIKEYAKGEIEVKSKFFIFNPDNKPKKVIEYTTDGLESKNENLEKYENLDSDRKLIIIKNDENYGFAEGNNIAIRYALKTLKPGYVLLLNNDTVVDNYFVKELVTIGERDKSIGIIGPKIYYYDRDGKNNVIWFAGGKIGKWSGKTYHLGRDKEDKDIYDEIKECEYLTGCAILLRRNLVEQLKGFDSSYFAYYEDVDLSVRATRRGWKNVYVPTSKVWHKVSKSTTKRGKKFSPTTIYYITRNKILFMKKHKSKFRYILFIIYFITYRNAQMFMYLLLIEKDTTLLKKFYQGMIASKPFNKS
ncbi:hypothetical protein EO95_13910 [Methanosarcina sp. 1.H.T.1A.1]|nr:hypothetical protein EO95_13910 [Methanosarcina sp. 1.H.T.1A.1]